MIGKISFHLFLNFLYYSLFSAFSFLAAFFLFVFYSLLHFRSSDLFSYSEDFSLFFFLFFFFLLFQCQFRVHWFCLSWIYHRLICISLNFYLLFSIFLFSPKFFSSFSTTSFLSSSYRNPSWWFRQFPLSFPSFFLVAAFPSSFLSTSFPIGYLFPLPQFSFCLFFFTFLFISAVST